MFWRQNTAEKIELPEVKPPSILTRPKPRLVVNNDDDRMLEYERLADEIGLKSAAIVQTRILRVMAENGIPRYDYGEVYAYLKRIAVREGQIFIWQPLRERDMPKGWVMRGGDNPADSSRGHGSYQNEWKYRPYNKAVPIEVLRHVKIIQERVPEALFFVSDYAAPDPDPFIMTRALDTNIIVFGCWDEPGFFAEKK